jgi:hypothetical protein
MADDRPQPSPEIGVAKIGMWQAVLVAAITTAAGVFTTIYLRPPAQKPPAIASNPEPVSTNPEKPAPLYTQNAEAFVRSSKTVPYKWNGYRSDVLKLHSLVKDFLSSLVGNSTSYQDASSFYDAMGDAADLVHKRASDVDPSGEKMVDYNWKVYSAPYIFRLEIQDLRKAHKDGHLESQDEIDRFRNEFDTWLLNLSGEQFSAGDLLP